MQALAFRCGSISYRSVCVQQSWHGWPPLLTRCTFVMFNCVDRPHSVTISWELRFPASGSGDLSGHDVTPPSQHKGPRRPPVRSWRCPLQMPLHRVSGGRCRGEPLGVIFSQRCCDPVCMAVCATGVNV